MNAKWQGRMVFLLVMALSCQAIGHAATVTSTRIAPESSGQTRGILFATIDGHEQAIAKQVWHAWILEGGRTLLWAGSDGAGGYENEGQSLWRYNANSGHRYKVMSEVFEIENIIPTRTRSGRLALVVTMTDGGLGAPHVAVVNPLRGEVWRHMVARVAGIHNGNLAVAVLRSQDIDGAHPETISKLRPVRMIYLNLDKVLGRPRLHVRSQRG